MGARSAIESAWDAASDGNRARGEAHLIGCGVFLLSVPIILVWYLIIGWPARFAVRTPRWLGVPFGIVWFGSLAALLIYAWLGPSASLTPRASTPSAEAVVGEVSPDKRVLQGSGEDAVGLVPNGGEVPDPVSGTVLTVVRVIDGDTVDVTGGERVRLVGIDTPEKGEACYREARERLLRIVLDQEVRLTRMGVDRYGRTLGYIDVNPEVFTFDPVPDLLVDGLAEPRYNSTDGYGTHPREAEYAEYAARAEEPGCGPTVERTPATPADPPSVPKPDPASPPSGDVDEDDSNGGGYPGYNGPRCYEPGGKDWKPCPESG